MLKLLDITKKYGNVTFEYPFGDYSVSRNFRGKPVYGYGNCIGCAACGIACPSDAIGLDLNTDKTKLKWSFDAGRCIFCGRCEEVCPVNTIKLSSEFELAVKFEKDALVQEGDLLVKRCKGCDKPFTTTRLINYALERLEKANLSKERLESSKEYIYLCPECKKSKTVDEFTKKDGDKRIL